jgi:hypothetical protein
MIGIREIRTQGFRQKSRRWALSRQDWRSVKQAQGNIAANSKEFPSPSPPEIRSTAAPAANRNAWNNFLSGRIMQFFVSLKPKRMAVFFA